MNPKITVVLRRPDRVDRGLETARTLAGIGRSAQVVFFCPGCISGLDCSAADNGAERPRLPCFSDCREDCIPRGFRCVDTEHIARLVRESDIVVPV